MSDYFQYYNPYAGSVTMTPGIWRRDYIPPSYPYAGNVTMTPGIWTTQSTTAPTVTNSGYFQNLTEPTGTFILNGELVSPEVERQIRTKGAADTINTFSAVTSIGIQLGATIYGSYANHEISKAQARIAKAQAQIEANQYAAQAIGYEVTAQRIAESYGAQEYETLRQQRAYIEDMKTDAVARGGEIDEGSNAYMRQAQQEEFDRQNAYASLQNDREQANYMLAANQCLVNADQALKGGRIVASSIKSQSNYQMASNWLNFGTGLLNTATKWAERSERINSNPYKYY